MSPAPQVLFVNATVYSTADPGASALVVTGNEVTWIGPTDSALTLFGDDPTLVRVDLDGHLITPSFVDLLAPEAGPSTEGGAGPEGDADAAARGITSREDARSGRFADSSAPPVLVAPESAPETDFLALAASGTPFAFGSGGSEASPWAWLYAAAYAPPSERRMSDRAAFLASTRAPRRLRGEDHPGSLNPGAPASLVVWEPWDLVVRGNDERIQTWSTDPRSRTPMLPDLTGGSFPSAVLTLHEGRVLHDADALLAQVAGGPGESSR
ncbi:MAG: hypothetical protein Q4G21_04280 [Dermabacter sp.]|nr:hypothetical protein [Dermabacter sp.]